MGRHARCLDPDTAAAAGGARALLQRPDWLFLDEATSALDEASEARLYRLLKERLPNATLVSVGHRSTLAAFHERHLDLARYERPKKPQNRSHSIAIVGA